MRVAVVQAESSTDSAANREQLADRLGKLSRDVDLVVLPEAVMHDFGSPTHDLATAAEPLDGPFVQLLADHAQRLNATIVAGMFEAADRLPFNTVVAVGPNGHLQAAYRKVHLYDSFGYRESDRLAAADIEPALIDVGGMRWGLLTCYDLRFPEFARLVIDHGADGLLVPAAWVAGEHKLDHWRTLLAARAIENTAVVVAAGQGSDRYSGHSMVLDPMGVILAEAGNADETLTVDVDVDRVSEVRQQNPSLANRRMKS